MYLEKAAGIDFGKDNKMCHDTPPQKSSYFAGARSQCIIPGRTGTGFWVFLAGMGFFCEIFMIRGREINS